MGRVRTSRRRNSKNKEYKKSHDVKRRTRDVDQIQDDLALPEPVVFEIDEELPGQGQFYCVPCARHFQDAATLALHTANKVHKRKCKDAAQPRYSAADAELAAGKTKEILPPAHPNLMTIMA